MDAPSERQAVNFLRGMRRGLTPTSVVTDESGVTAIEYALIASLIAVFIIVAVQAVGTKVSTVFNEVSTTLK